MNSLMRSMIIAGGLAAGVALSAHDADATVITVNNNDFELPTNPALTVGQQSFTNTTNFNALPSWNVATTGGGYAGVWYLPSAPNYTIPAPSGNQVGYLNPNGATSSIFQTTSSLFQNNTTYTLSFYVGQEATATNAFPTGGVTAILYEGNTSTVLDTITVLAPGQDSFALDSFNFSASNDPTGGDIGIEFLAAGTGEVAIDDVGLTTGGAGGGGGGASSVPEPAGLPLLGIALLGFVAFNYRQKKMLAA